MSSITVVVRCTKPLVPCISALNTTDDVCFRTNITVGGNASPLPSGSVSTSNPRHRSGGNHRRLVHGSLCRHRANLHIDLRHLQARLLLAMVQTRVLPPQP